MEPCCMCSSCHRNAHPHTCPLSQSTAAKVAARHILTLLAMEWLYSHLPGRSSGRVLTCQAAVAAVTVANHCPPTWTWGVASGLKSAPAHLQLTPQFGPLGPAKRIQIKPQTAQQPVGAVEGAQKTAEWVNEYMWFDSWVVCLWWGAALMDRFKITCLHGWKVSVCMQGNLWQWSFILELAVLKMSICYHIACKMLENITQRITIAGWHFGLCRTYPVSLKIVLISVVSTIKHHWMVQVWKWVPYCRSGDKGLFCFAWVLNVLCHRFIKTDLAPLGVVLCMSFELSAMHPLIALWTRNSRYRCLLSVKWATFPPERHHAKFFNVQYVWFINFP